MLSTLILGRDPARPAPSAEALTRGLAALVPAAVEGLIKDVVIAGPSEDAELQRIADHAGCTFAAGEPGGLVRAGLAAIRAPRVLVILGGEAPGEGFADELSDFLAGQGERALLRRRFDSGWRSLLPFAAPVTGAILPAELLRRSSPTRFAQVVAIARPASTLQARTRSLA